jgi:signal transduction histidine kinase
VGGVSIACYQRLSKSVAVAARPSGAGRRASAAYIDGLASGLAHEIRNPLNSLNLNMQLLEEGERGARRGELAPAVADHHSQRISASSGERLLSYARPRPELERVPAVALLEHCLEVLAGEIEECGARVEIEDRADGAEVRVDRAQLGQLLLNLAQNALTATQGTGRPPLVRLNCHRHGSRVVLEVIDNGVGIPPKELEKIFELFYSTRKGGSGLGLAIVQRIARAHDAELAVQSTLGVGTSVSVSLPAAGAEARPRQAVEAVTR